MKPSDINNDRTIKKFWISRDKQTDSIILVANKMIYKGNKKLGQIDESISQLYSDKIPEGLFSLPYGYINRIQMQEGKKFLDISFKKESNEHLRIEDENKRKEIFEYLKKNRKHKIHIC